MNRLLLPIAIILVSIACACNGSKLSQSHETTPDSTITHARLLVIEPSDSFTLVTINNPWKEGEALHRYIIVPYDSVVPTSLPQGTLVRTPLRQALVYSSVHTSIMKELGMFASVKGVCDSKFFPDPDILKGIESGFIADCGSSMSPTIEKVIEMQPDGILLSPYQDATYGQIDNLNIPIIECADYMEYTPLGRAEWVKFYGLLLGKEEDAKHIFDDVAENYNAIKDQASHASSRPMVLTEMVINGVWNVPGGQSYMARILQDAGADYPWSDDKSTGSLNLDFNQVLALAQKADVWLIKSFYIHSYQDLKNFYGLNDQFEAFKNKRVYICDTNKTHLFEEFPFHPDRLLKDYYIIFHPDLAKENTVFFQPL
ncbi:MAG: ABC transporter substrate-binding protein [Muribaculaceae bacterium]|nr:ABC transporter substrate-binding protein [Muribaculaceae bacterium]